MALFILIVTSLGIGIACSLPGILIGQWLAVKGFVRDHPIRLALFCMAVILFFARLGGASIPWWGYLWGSILPPLGFYRADMAIYWDRGSWWWLKKEFADQVDDPLGIWLDVICAILVVGMIMWIVLSPPSGY